MKEEKKGAELFFTIGVVTAVTLGIYLSSLYTYVLFHGLVELVSVAIAFAIFIMAWNASAYLANNYLRLLGIGYAFIAFIDLIHTFSFQGMAVFIEYDNNLAPQLWLAARYLQAATLFAAPLMLDRKMNNHLVFVVYIAVVATLLTLIFSGHFPDCLITGKGLTPFKVYSEYVISAVLLAALVLLYRKRHTFDRAIFILIALSIALTIASELCFTAFVSMYDFSNKLGHYAKLAAFYLIYRAILVTGFKQPLELIFRDLKRAEEALKQQAAELTVAKELAERANRYKSVFLASMSHELRTPLNAILGFAQVMQNSAYNPKEQKENLEVISRSGEHLLNLINNVLDISKIESGRIELEKSPCDLHQLLQEINSFMHAHAASKHLSFTLEQAEEVPRQIVADCGKLRQVLINLIGNGIKYTPRGGVVLRVMLQSPTSPEETRLRFEIEDSGPGIPEADRERVFSSFVQLENRSTSEAGTGLGLAICKQYMMLMDGTIGVDGAVGGGSVFWFELPVQVVADGGTAVPERLKVIGLAEDQPRYRLLIAEDQPANRLLLRRLLSPFGFELRDAVNGKEVLTAFEEWHPDLIFMDIQMPVMDGLTATRRIREREDGAKAKIVAVTAHAFEDERQGILSAGCDDFIRKPFHDYEIFKALTDYLGVRFVYDENTPAAESPKRLTAADLAGLPDDLNQELEDGLSRIKIEAIKQTIEKIRSHDPALADGLAARAKELQFGWLLQLVRAARKESGAGDRT